MSLVDSLFRLFQVDAQLRGLKQRLESAQRYCTAQNTLLTTLNEERDELLARRKHAQATMANMETETAAIDERIEKLRNELNSAETNKQYAAILTEMNTIKAGRGEVEENILAEMETIETLDARLAELQEQHDEREKVRAIAENQLKERQTDVGERVAELEVEREQAATGIPAAALTLFDEVAHVCEGETMAPVVEIDRRHRDYACGVCNMTMPFEYVSLLLNNGESIVQCTACKRILYMEQETKGALAKK